MTRRPRCPVCEKKVKIDRKTAYVILLLDDFTAEEFCTNFRKVDAPPWLLWDYAITGLLAPEPDSNAELLAALGVEVVALHESCIENYKPESEFVTKDQFRTTLRQGQRQ